MSYYRADYAGIGQMLRSEFMEAAMVALAERAKQVAEATAPYDPAGTTHFRDSFEVTSRRDGGHEHDRASASLVNTDDAALWIELGTSDTPAHHTMAKALDAVAGGL